MVGQCSDLIRVKIIRDLYDAPSREKISDLISTELKLSKSEFKVLRTPDGKPYLTSEFLRLSFSVSHSDLHFFLGLNRDGISMGLDLERIRARSINPVLVKRFFSEKEGARIMASDDKAAELLRLWSRKESLAKCLGTGMVFPFASMDTVNDSVFFGGKQIRIHSERVVLNGIWYWLSVSLQSDRPVEIEHLKNAETFDRKVSAACASSPAY